jgi:LCCL domain
MARRTLLGRRRGLGRLVTLVVVAVIAAACGGGSDDEDTGDTTTTDEETTTTEEASTSTTADPAAADLWALTASDHRAEVGEEFEYECPPGGTIKSLWGTEIYTDDSSVCTAAVHVGLITLEDGGTVTIEIAPGEPSYEPGLANDVTSTYYAVYPGSFIFPDAPPGSGDFEPPPESWQATAAGVQVGDDRTVECAPNGTFDGVWGTGTYTSDSSICTAAVHGGVITQEDGGAVTVEVVEGLDSYEGSSANGVTSMDYAAYPTAFELSG